MLTAASGGRLQQGAAPDKQYHADHESHAQRLFDRISMTRSWRATLFLAVVGLSLWALFEWRAARVEEIIRKTEPGDVVTVGTDVCEKLRGRGLIAHDTDCGYRGAARVRIIEPPE